MPAKIIFVDKFDPTLKPSIVSWTSLKGWLMDKIRSVQALQKIRKQTKTSNQQIITDAKLLYQTMNESMAKRDVKQLQETTTEGMFVNLKASIPPAGPAKYEWKCNFTRNPRIMQARVAQTPQGDQLAQVTVSMDTKQSLTIHDKNGQSGGEELAVHEYVVLDRWVSVADSKWRISGKIE